MHKGNNSEFFPEPYETRVATFIRKIYSILEEQLFPEIVDWNTEGTAIIIKKPTDFSQKVLPKYFKHNHISSFIRQLNMYNFQKKRSRHAGHIYCHELFQRGQKQLLPQIKRKVKEIISLNSQTSVPNGSSQSLSQDFSALLDENKMLKDLQDQVFSKVHSLEQKLKELVIQNQTLQTQLRQQKQKEHYLMSNFQKAKQDFSMHHMCHAIPPQHHEKSWGPQGNLPKQYMPHYAMNHHINVHGPQHKAGGEEEVFIARDNAARQEYELGVSEKYRMFAQNSSAFNGLVKNHTLEAVSPSTKPSPSQYSCESPESFIDYNSEPTTLLKKRPLDFTCEKAVFEDCGAVDETRKYVKMTPSENHPVNPKKFQNYSYGDNYFEETPYNHVDFFDFE